MRRSLVRVRQEAQKNLKYVSRHKTKISRIYGNSNTNLFGWWYYIFYVFVKKTKIINLFGGPGCGKSTIASGIFYELKKKHYSVDIPYEFPKEVFWEQNLSQISDQLFILANQHRGIVRAYGKVDFIILDSPILLSPIYRDNYSNEYPASLYDENFDEFVLNLFKKYNNMNFFLRRPSSDFQKEGRFQDSEGSIEIDNKIIDLLTQKEIPFVRLPVNGNTVDFITNYLIKVYHQE